VQPKHSAKWPWERAPFWIILAVIAGVGVGLASAGADGALIALACGFGLLVYGFDLLGEIAKVRRLKGLSKPRPGLDDWLPLGVCASCCLLALYLLLRTDEWRGATVTLAFFGSAVLFFAANIRRKRRERRLAGTTVTIAGGVDIYAGSGPSMLAIALGCCIVGSIIFFLGADFPLLMRLIGAFIALVGVAVSIAIWLGYYARQFLRFEPDAAIFGEPGYIYMRQRGYRYRVEWNNIASACSFDDDGIPCVGIRLRDVAAVSVNPPSQKPEFKQLTRNRRAGMRMHLVIVPGVFRMDGPTLAATLQRYAQDPSARAELRRIRTLTRP
jgi:hypothetical protein